MGERRRVEDSGSGSCAEDSELSEKEEEVDR
jgi:hypothetical protein